MAAGYSGLVVWITGGGSGIGRALAIDMAKRGAKLAVSGRRVDRLESVVSEIVAAGGDAMAVACDVTEPETVAAAVAQVVERFGRLDIAVANAGFSVSGRFEVLSAEDWRRQLDVNVVGAVTTVQAALPELHKTKGRIGLVASVAGMICTPGSSAYSASKFALRAIGLTLSQELHGTGVTCTTLHPGFVASEINQVDNAGVYHADRKDRRPQRFMWPTDKAAAVMARAILKRKREYVFTWHGRFGAFLGRHSPGVVHAVMTRGSARKRAFRTTAPRGG